MDPLDKFSFLELLDEDPEVFDDFIHSGFGSPAEEEEMIRKRIDLQKKTGTDTNYVARQLTNSTFVEPTVYEEVQVGPYSRINFPKVTSPIVVGSPPNLDARLTPVLDVNMTHRTYESALTGVNHDQVVEQSHEQFHHWDRLTPDSQKSWPVLQHDVRSKKTQLRDARDRRDVLEMKYRGTQLECRSTLSSRPTLFLYCAASRADAERDVLRSELWRTGIVVSNTQAMVEHCLCLGHSVITTDPRIFEQSTRLDRRSLARNRVIISVVQSARVIPRNNVIYTSIDLRSTFRCLYTPVRARHRPLSLYMICGQLTRPPDLAMPSVNM